VTTDERLDRLTESVTDLKVTVAALAGDVRALLGRVDERDRALERLADRVTGVERRVWAIPSVATLIAIAAALVSVYGQVAR
jgi:hypothetical protein